MTTQRYHASVAANIAIAIVYLVIALVSLKLAFVHVNVAAVWPPTGLAAAVLLLLGRRCWPGIFVGALAVNLIANFQNPAEVGGISRVLSALGIAAGNTAEAVLASLLAVRFAGGQSFLERGATFVRYAATVALLAPLASATVGITSLGLFGLMRAENLGRNWLTWYTADVAALLVVTPLILAWRRLPTRAQLHWTRGLELLAIAVLLGMIGQTICGVYFSDPLQSFPKSYMIIPVLLWISFRYGIRGATVGILMLGAMIVWGTLRGFAVFPTGSPNLSLLYAQVFLSVAAVITLSVACLLQELAETNSGLEQAVTDRTAKLEQLVQDKQDLVILAAHDMQSPLIGLRNLLDLVDRDPELVGGAQWPGILAEMRKSCEQMLRWVRRLVDVERVEHLIDHRKLHVVDIEPVVRACASQLQSTADAKHIRIVVRGESGVCRAWADAECVSHIVVNLLSNAIKFSPPGETVTVALTNGRPHCRIVVHNRGLVIPAKDQQHLFEKFSRLRPRPTGGERSQGVGLFLTQRLSRALNGQIDCASSAAQGTSFVVDLPTASTIHV